MWCWCQEFPQEWEKNAEIDEFPEKEKQDVVQSSQKDHHPMGA